MNDATVPRFLISTAAELTGMHPQTLREYDRLGIVAPARTRGRGRRYSLDDIAQLREVQQLTQVEGVNLSGVKRIMKLERQLAAARAELHRLRLIAEPGRHRVFAANQQGDVVVVRAGRRVTLQDASSELVRWEPR